MKLILGIGVVGKASIEYFSKECLCFYDDILKEYTNKAGVQIPFFENWDEVDTVIVSPGFSTDHPMILEAIKRNIDIESDISVFLKNEEMIGVKIGITGTNGKSTLCALLKYILGDLAEIGGNFGMSPLEFKKNCYYLLELSSYQLHWLKEESLKLLDIGVITNIGNHHIKYHKTKSEYVRVKNKILNAHKSFYNFEIDENLQYPKNKIFEQNQYKLALNIIVEILKVLNLDQEKALKKLESYSPLKYRQQVISDSPFIVNDSKATNYESMFCALDNMRKDFVLINQIYDYSFNEEGFDIHSNPFLQKIFILSNQEIVNLKLPFFVSNDFEQVVKEAFRYSKEKDLGLLFSPGFQSFEFFKNFEKRGEVFDEIIKFLLEGKNDF
ncbi:Mur ligase family protein [Alphaproteobacteria bacterium endosymbiont of Tiliacea citrago]|uniref:Mur ligase family protein n=1 Tax=Alphaproteobacteria bacterium endosymbiont of Tiliacea citrago TaxID=3077944 RepID=UPI00313D695F